MTKAALLDEIAGLNRQLGAARSQGLEDRAHVRDQVLHQPHRTWAKMIRLLLPRMGGGSASGGDSFDSECAHGVTSCDACTDASSTRTREAYAAGRVAGLREAAAAVRPALEEKP